MAKLTRAEIDALDATGISEIEAAERSGVEVNKPLAVANRLMQGATWGIPRMIEAGIKAMPDDVSYTEAMQSIRDKERKMIGGSSAMGDAVEIGGAAILPDPIDALRLAGKVPWKNVAKLLGGLVKKKPGIPVAEQTAVSTARNFLRGKGDFSDIQPTLMQNVYKGVFQGGASGALQSQTATDAPIYSGERAMEGAIGLGVGSVLGGALRPLASGLSKPKQAARNYALESAGINVQEAKKILKTTSTDYKVERLDELGDRLLEMGVIKPGLDPNAVQERVWKARQAVGEGIGEIIDNNAAIKIPKKEMLDNLQDVMDALKGSPKINKAAMRSISDISDDVSKWSEGDYLPAHVAWANRVDLDDAYSTAMGNSQTRAAKEIRKARHAIEKSISDRLPDEYGEMKKAYKDLSDLSDASGMYDKAVLSGLHRSKGVTDDSLLMKATHAVGAEAAPVGANLFNALSKMGVGGQVPSRGVDALRRMATAGVGRVAAPYVVPSAQQ